MSPEVALALQERAARDFETLSHPVLGLTAAKGRYDNLYLRDLTRFAKFTLTHPINWAIPKLVDTIQRGLDMAIKLQGTKTDPETGEQPGRIIHEYAHSDLTPRERLEELLAGGMPVRVNKETDSLWMKTYFGNDPTPGFISAIALTARTKQTKKDIGDYLEDMKPALLAAWQHQTTTADIDGDGLVESIVGHGPLVVDHNERDSLYTYLLEDGRRPQGVVKYLSTNAINLEATQDVAWIGSVLGMPDLIQDALERYQLGYDNFQRAFWDNEKGYAAPLVFGDNERADFVGDEALDGMWYGSRYEGGRWLPGIWNQAQAERIRYRLSQPDMEIPRWGQRTRSRFSRYYYLNGAKAYWNGPIWPHRLGVAYESYMRYGFRREAEVKGWQFGALTSKKGNCELQPVDDKQRLVDYRERRIKKNCHPHLFSVGAALAIAASELSFQEMQIAA